MKPRILIIADAQETNTILTLQTESSPYSFLAYGDTLTPDRIGDFLRALPISYDAVAVSRLDIHKNLREVIERE